jgi:hypothetical protein
MLMVTRYRVDAGEASFPAAGAVGVGGSGELRGWRSGHVGRAVDDPTSWVRTGGWDDVGCYWRGLSPPENKMSMMPLPRGALDEPTAFELLSDLGGTGSALAADAELVGVGGRSAPVVAPNFDRQ